MPDPLLVLVQPLVNPGFPEVPFRIEPLSLMVIASRTPAPWRVRLLDGAVEKRAGRLIDPTASLVGITMVTATNVSAFATADAYRRLGIPVILGGAGVMLDPEAASAHADAIILGEIEGRWHEVLADALARRLQPVYRFGQAADFSGIPDRRLMPYYRWRYPFVSVIQTTRGCPYACPFCAPATYYGQKLRHRPVADVVAEIRSIHQRHGRRMIGFTDDNLVGDRAYAKELLTAILPLRIRWSAQCCLDIARDEELLDLAKASGCMSLMVGLEAVEQSSLGDAGKGAQIVAGYPELIRRIQARDIMLIATFTIGHDHDDETVYDRVLGFCRDNRVDFPLFMTLMVHPGIRLHDRLKTEGRLVHDPEGIHPFRAGFQPARLDRGRIPERLADLYGRYYDARYLLANLGHWLRRGRLRRVVNLLVFYVAYFSFIRTAARTRPRASTVHTSG
jgi:hypothetical protein